MKWIQSEFIFNTGSQSEYLQYRIKLLGTIKCLVLVLYLSLMMNWKYDHVIAKAGETTNPLISSKEKEKPLDPDYLEWCQVYSWGLTWILFTPFTSVCWDLRIAGAVWLRKLLVSCSFRSCKPCWYSKYILNSELKKSWFIQNFHFRMRIWVLGTWTSTDLVPHDNGNVCFLAKAMTWVYSTTFKLSNIDLVYPLYLICLPAEV